jgi:hypothetical protein
MRSAPAEIAGERSADIVFRRFGFFGKKSGGANDHAAGAIAALRHLFFDEGGLYRMRRRDRSESLKRNDRFALRIRNRLKARSRRASVEENAAGAALAEATSEFGRGQPQSAQAEKQRLIWIRRLDRALEPVNTKPVAGHGVAMEFLLAACSFSNFTEIEAYRNCSQSKRELRLRHTLGRGLPDTVAVARYHRLASRRSTITVPENS